MESKEIINNELEDPDEEEMSEEEEEQIDPKVRPSNCSGNGGALHGGVQGRKPLNCAVTAGQAGGRDVRGREEVDSLDVGCE